MSTLTLDNSNTSTTEVSQAKEITQKPHSFATVVDCHKNLLRIVFSFHDGKQGGCALVAWNPNTHPERAGIFDGGRGLIPDNIIDAAMVAIPKTLMGVKIDATYWLEKEGPGGRGDGRFDDNKMWNFVGLQIQLPDLQEAAAGSNEIPF